MARTESGGVNDECKYGMDIMMNASNVSLDPFATRSALCSSMLPLRSPTKKTTHGKAPKKIHKAERDDKKKVTDLLFSDEGCHFPVILIVGMGGLGKTTLAQLVYNDPDFWKHFNLQGWVFVSVDFDVPRITRTIIESISKNPWGLTVLSSLQDTLRKQVEGKSVLLVLDVVWNDQRSLWEPLQLALVGGKWIRVIVTTRDSKVAEIMQAISAYTLNRLDEDQCRLLFRRHAFGAENSEGQLVEIGDKIVKECAGLLLAVKALGCMHGGETYIEVGESSRE